MEKYDAWVAELEAETSSNEEEEEEQDAVANANEDVKDKACMTSELDEPPPLERPEDDVLLPSGDKANSLVIDLTGSPVSTSLPPSRKRTIAPPSSPSSLERRSKKRHVALPSNTLAPATKKLVPKARHTSSRVSRLPAKLLVLKGRREAGKAKHFVPSYLAASSSSSSSTVTVSKRMRIPKKNKGSRSRSRSPCKRRRGGSGSLSYLDTRNELLREVLSWDPEAPPLPPSKEVLERLKVYTEHVETDKNENKEKQRAKVGQGSAGKGGDGEAERYRSCARYNSPQAYTDVFHDLLMENTRAEIRAALESLDKYSIASSMAVDSVEANSETKITYVKLYDGRMMKGYRDAAGCFGVISIEHPQSGRGANEEDHSAKPGKKRRRQRPRKRSLPEAFALCHIVQSSQSSLKIQLVVPLIDSSGKDLPLGSTAAHTPKDNYERLLAMRETLLAAERERRGKKTTRFFVAALSHVVTTVREYFALCNVGSATLSKQILDPRTSVPPSRSGISSSSSSSDNGDDASSMDLQLPEKFSERLSHVLNSSQHGAVKAAMEGRPFTLLQGPPGTGKTRTAVELLNAFHLSRFQTYYRTLVKKTWQSVRKRAYDSEQRLLVKAGMIPSKTGVPSSSSSSSSSSSARPQLSRAAPRAVSLSDILKALESTEGGEIVVSPKPHILVCAPSNAAVDELARRVLQQQFMDGENIRYQPNILRIGKERKESGNASMWGTVSLDAQVDGIMRKGRRACAEQVKTSQADMLRIKKSLGKLKATAVEFMKWYNAEITKQHARVGRPPQPWKLLTEEKWGSVELSPQHPSFQQVEELKKHMAHFMEQLRYAQLYQERHKLVATAPTEKYGSSSHRRRGDPSASRESLSLAAKTRDQVCSALVKNALQVSFLDEAEIVFCTLSAAGSELMRKRQRPWDYILVDEAAQSVELSTLVALQHQTGRCVLIGDPQQLPATVQMASSNARLYEQSLFERLVRGGHPVSMLDTQYRMHPEISAFPSRHFYRSKLQNGPNVTSEHWAKPFHKNPRFRPLLFLDVPSAHQYHFKSSFNSAEVNCIASVLSAFVGEHVELPEEEAPEDGEIRKKRRKTSVGVITPYAHQRRLLAERLGALHRRKGWGMVDLKVATVDGFQGGEKDVIIFSCVRSGDSHGIGFLADVRRMNVALTRARYACWVVGNADTLKKNRHWGSFIRHCERNGAFVSKDRVRGLFGIARDKKGCR